MGIPLNKGVTTTLGSNVKTALSDIRRLAKVRGVPADTQPWKDAYRVLYAQYGPNEADRFAMGFRTPLHRDTLLTDMKHGYDEVDYPLGAPRLPRGALKDDARRVARAAAIRARRGARR